MAMPLLITHMANSRAMIVISTIVPQMIKVTTIAVFIPHLPAGVRQVIPAAAAFSAADQKIGRAHV
jgi:hypothetical protein